MSNLDRRVAAMEKGLLMDGDGRDPGVIELVKMVCKSEGWEFEREMVPPGYTMNQLLAEIDGKSRGLPSERSKRSRGV